MPYIKQESRERLKEAIDDLTRKIITEAVKTTPSVGKSIADKTKGVHNYVMFMIALKLARTLGISYRTLQDIVGTFECCKAEFLRRVVAPYEDGAIERNGDIEGL